MEKDTTKLAVLEWIKKMKSKAIYEAKYGRYDACVENVESCLKKIKEYNIDDSLFVEVVRDCFNTFMEKEYFTEAERFSLKYKKYLNAQSDLINDKNEKNVDKNKLKFDVDINTMIVSLISLGFLVFMFENFNWIIAILASIIFPLIYINIGKLVYKLTSYITKKNDIVYKRENDDLYMNEIIKNRYYIGSFWPFVLVIINPVLLISILIGKLFNEY